MPTGYIATPARIRRIRREAEFARYSQPSVLATYPHARDGFTDVQESFFDLVADAQTLTNERATVLSIVRDHEAAETTQPFKLGSTVPLKPALPKARMIDKEADLDKNLIVKGISIDFHVGRNSIEAIG